MYDLEHIWELKQAQEQEEDSDSSFDSPWPHVSEQFSLSGISAEVVTSGMAGLESLEFKSVTRFCYFQPHKLKF